MLRRLVLLAVSVVAVVALFPGAASAAISPLSEFGEYGDGAGQFNPNVGVGADVTVAPDGRAYVADGNNRVVVFGADGAFLFAFGQDVGALGSDYCDAGTGCGPGLGNGTAGSIDSPSGIAIGPEGNVFIASYSYNRISVFEPDGGGFLYAFGYMANLSNPFEPNRCDAESGCRDEFVNSFAPGALYNPSGLAFDAQGHLLVAEIVNHRVSAFTPDGEFLYAIGRGVNIADGGNRCTAVSGCDVGDGSESGGAIVPQDIAVMPGGDLVVTDAGNSRATVLGPNGEFRLLFGLDVNEGPGDDNICTEANFCRDGELNAAEPGGLWNPNGVEVSAAGAIYVVDPFPNRVEVFDASGHFIEAFGGGVVDGSGVEEFQICTKQTGCLTGSGEYPGALPEPSGAAIDCRGALYVVEESTELARIGRFGEPGTASPPCPPKEEARPAPLPPPGGQAPAKPSNAFSFGKVKLNERKGTATLTVTVPGPGAVGAKGKGVKKAEKKARAAGKVVLPIVPTAKTKKTLDESQKAKLRVKVTFTPTGGAALTKEKIVHLKFPPEVRK